MTDQATQLRGLVEELDAAASVAIADTVAPSVPLGMVSYGPTSDQIAVPIRRRTAPKAPVTFSRSTTKETGIVTASNQSPVSSAGFQAEVQQPQILRGSVTGPSVCMASSSASVWLVIGASSFLGVHHLR